ncbi:hypothetical protein BZG35_15610 [Brevundimonas sp. LM2]|uniref:DUF2189 domain-containing protein n=1 Tax=Brevundimonas sp. LM2 TaxID=1938605 RepID=UPI0009839640|nr:DUF2189 domain-containing protein [Brevundimonas sp. LM2]AQR62920.1 hypothetical protein BZG35_15610 [Brevundimonas sp. LM2]
MSSISVDPRPTAAPGVRRITQADINWALSEGWKDFSAKRGDVLVLAVLYPVLGLLAAAIALNDRLLPVFFPLVAGLSVMGPAAAAGFYEIARRREAGISSSWIHFFDPLNGRSRTPLLMLTLMSLVFFATWIAAAWVIYQATLAQVGPMTIVGGFEQLFSTPEGWAMVVVGNLVGAVFAVLTVLLTLVSFPMVVDRPVDAGTAVATSIRAVGRNPGAVASWGLRVAALLLLGCLPLFMGLAVVLPVLGYATWHLYTRMVER